MKEKNKNIVNSFVLVRWLLTFLMVNSGFYFFFLELETGNYNISLINNFGIFKYCFFAIINILMVIYIFFNYRSLERENKAWQERIENKKLEEMKSLLNKDNYIKKYLSNEKYKEFQETLNDIPEDEKEDFKDLVFSELLKKQAEKYIKGGNDN